MSRFVVILLFGLITLTGSECLSQDIIRWDSDRPIRWKDFKGSIDTESPHIASTYSGVRYSFRSTQTGNNVVLEFEIYSYFNPSASWSIPEEQSDYVLNHEQVHFDISELHARLLRQEVQSVPYSDDFQDKMKAIFDRFNQDQLSMQEAYDGETNHSIIQEEQEKWNERIRKQLEQLSDYADPKVVKSIQLN